MRSRGARRSGSAGTTRRASSTSSDAFAGVGGEHPERRTVHLAARPLHGAGLAGARAARRSGRRRAGQRGPPRLRSDRDPRARAAAAGRRSSRSTATCPARRSRAGRSATRSRAARSIGEIGPAPENGDWPPHTHFQILADLLGSRRRLSRGRRGERARDLALPLPRSEPHPRRAGPPPARPRDGPERAALRSAGAASGPSLSLSYRAPLEIVRGAGAFLYDETGRGVPRHGQQRRPRRARASPRRRAPAPGRCRS